MPVENRIAETKPGFRWGKQGKCYTFTPGSKSSRESAKNKAAKQGRAMKTSQSREERGVE